MEGEDAEEGKGAVRERRKEIKVREEINTAIK